MNYFETVKFRALRPWLPAAAAALILLAHAFFSWRAIGARSATFDEPMHVAAGYTYWLRGDMRLDPNNPPLAKMLVAAPLLVQSATVSWDTQEWLGGYHYAFGERLMFWSGNNADRLLTSARSVNLLLSMMLLLVIWRWSRRRWGAAPGLAACAVAAASPTLQILRASQPPSSR